MLRGFEQLGADWRVEGSKHMPVIALFLESGKKFHSKSSLSAQLFTRVNVIIRAPSMGWNIVREEEMLLSVVLFYRNTVKFLS